MIIYAGTDLRWYLSDDYDSLETIKARREHAGVMPVRSQSRMSKARHRAKARRPRPKRFGALTMMLLCYLICGATSTWAFPIQVQQLGIVPSCDPLNIPVAVDELGFPAVFPPDERIDAITTMGSFPAPCPQFDNPTLPEFGIQAQNLTMTTFTEVWYVADPQTNVSNVDGLANELIPGFGPTHEAFRIDRLASDPNGSHHPLIGESLIQDGLWQPGEFWRFILQDYTNAFNLPPHLFNTLHIGDATINTPAVMSTGSIIAIPEPASASFFAIGLMITAYAARRRRA